MDCVPQLRHWLSFCPCVPRKKQLRGIPSFHAAIHASNAKVRAKLPSVLSLPVNAACDKIVYLVRHAEAEHNVHEKQAEEEARKQGADEEDVIAAGKRAISNGMFLDASLSLGGQDQVTSSLTSSLNYLK